MSELVQHWYSLVQAFGTASAEEQEELPEDIRDMLSEYAKMSKIASAACGPAHESTFKHVTLGLGFEIAESFDVLCHLARKRIVSAAAQLPVAFSVELEASAGKIQSCKALNSFWEIHAEVSGLWRNIVRMTASNASRITLCSPLCWRNYRLPTAWRSEGCGACTRSCLERTPRFNCLLHGT